MNQPARSFHWPSALQLILCGAGALGFWGLGIFLLFFHFTHDSNDPGFLMLSIEAWIFGWLVLPGATSALQRLMGSPLPAVPVEWITARLLIFIFPLVVLAGIGISNLPLLAGLLLPVLYVLGIGIPLAWFIGTGARRLKALSRQRAWGIFGVSLSWTPVVILLAEMVLGIGVLVLVVAILSSEPGFVSSLEKLAGSFQSGIPDLRNLEQFANEYLARPWVAALAVGFIAGVVPFLEEALKPLALWAFAGRNLNPAAGFVGGMLSGAAFAMFESLALLTSAGDFGTIVSTRLGTSLIHVVTGGLTGWGIALAFEKRTPFPLIGRYLLAVIIHAAWNGLTAMTVVSLFPEVQSLGGNLPWEQISAIGLPVLGVLGFVLLLLINQYLYKQLALHQAALAPVDTLPPEPASRLESLE